MYLLDCHNTISTYTSLSKLFGVQVKDIQNFLFAKGKDTENDDYVDSFIKRLLSELLEKYSKQENAEGTCWFHLTRVSSKTDFSEGLLPVRENINRIWDFLASLLPADFDPNTWREFRKTLESDQLNIYRLKTTTRENAGPFAMLVRDVAFIPKRMHNHDYLSIPEIVEDICIPFEEQYRIKLSKLYISATQPCIVKFFHPNFVLYEHASTALYYLYTSLHKKPLHFDCNTCFSGNGETIQPEQILSVEYLD